MSRRFLVTGGAGFIGSHLCRSLANRGDEVVILDSLDSGNPGNIQDLLPYPNVTFVQGSIEDYPLVESLCTDIDGIFHLAALVSVQRSIEDPKLNHRVNVDGTFNIFESARVRSVPKIVLASSAALYGNSYDPPHNESFPADPLSPYAAGKYSGEVYSSVYSLYGVSTVCLRFFNVYGPNQDPSSPYSGVISRFLDATIKGEACTIFGDGNQTRDFVYVLDVVSALMLSMDSDAKGVFNVGTGNATSIRLLAQEIMKIAGKEGEIRFREAREGEVRHSSADISKITAAMGYHPEYSLIQGLRETHAWWIRQH